MLTRLGGDVLLHIFSSLNDEKSVFLIVWDFMIHENLRFLTIHDQIVSPFSSDPLLKQS
jgi:hypothetical protein